jgi:hypothetical protein
VHRGGATGCPDGFWAQVCSARYTT